MLDTNKILANPIIRTIVLMLSIVLGIIVFSAIFLKIYTLHGRSWVVPDVKGLSMDEAKEILEDHKLSFQLSDSVFQIGVNPGAIIEQNPAAGTFVKKNRKVYITINAVNPQMIEMPNAIGVSRRQAKSLLEANGLIIGHIKYVPDIAFDNVLHQRFKGKDIDPGTPIAKGSKIELILGRGFTDESASVPVLKGLTLSAAQSLLTDSYLNLGVIIYDKTIISLKDSMNAIIYKQKPDPEKIQNIRLGAYIDVWLTTDTTKISQSIK